MTKNNNAWVGAVLGLILPGITFFFAKDLHIMGKANVPYILCVFFNLVMARYYFKSDKSSTAYGLLSATFFCAFIFLIFKARQ